MLVSPRSGAKGNWELLETELSPMQEQYVLFSLQESYYVPMTVLEQTI